MSRKSGRRLSDKDMRKRKKGERIPVRSNRMRSKAAARSGGRLLRYLLARSAEFGGKVLQFRQPIAHRQHSLGVVDVDAGRELQRRQRRREHIDQSERRVRGHHVAAALLAELPLAHRCLLEHGEVLGARHDPHRIGLPEREGVDRPARPRAAGAAMAIAHAFGLTRDLDLHGAAEALALMCSHLWSLSFASWMEARLILQPLPIFDGYSCRVVLGYCGTRRTNERSSFRMQCASSARRKVSTASRSVRSLPRYCS